MGRSRAMKIGTILAAVVAMLLGVAALAAAPAEAQEGREGGAFSYPLGGPSPDGYPPPDYAYRNGEVYVDGDEVLDCRTFVESFDEGYDKFGDQAQAERVLEQCERAGLPSGSPPPEVSARGDPRRPPRGGAAGDRRLQAFSTVVGRGSIFGRGLPACLAHSVKGIGRA